MNSSENYATSFHAGLKAARSPGQLLLTVKIICDPLPNVLTSQHFQNGQVPIPDKCTNFCMGILCVNPPEPTEKEHRLAFSLGSDFLFNATKGHVKPAKQLAIGLGTKSITGNEKVCKILHEFGHAISYQEEKGIIAEIGEAITKMYKTIPDGLYRKPVLATLVAWKNYDKLTDSIAAGRQAMHDCMGVVYQNKKHLHRWNLQQHTTKMQFLVPFTASNNWQRDLAAFDNMVLSSAAVCR